MPWVNFSPEGSIAELDVKIMKPGVTTSLTNCEVVTASLLSLSKFVHCGGKWSSFEAYHRDLLLCLAEQLALRGSELLAP